VRYGPTAALVLGERPSGRRALHTGIVANEFAADEKAGGEEAVQELEQLLTGPVRLPAPLPEPGHLIATLLDELIVLDSTEPPRDGGYGWSPLERARDDSGDTLGKWFALPFGGPERIVLAGFATAAEQSLRGSRRGSSRGPGNQPGSEIFQSLCGLMANGARTILISRWRTGGRTNFDLVREFVQELPQVPGAEAWQRACLLAREAPLDAAREPRLKKAEDAGGEMPTAAHPFFWAGYLLVDCGSQSPDENGGEAEKEEEEVEAMPGDIAKQEAADGKPLPPPERGAEKPTVATDGAGVPPAESGKNATDSANEATE
jgi:hypothetical protein